MKVIHKNLLETLSLLLSLGDEYGGEAFSIVFTSGDILTRSYTCSYDGSEYINCEMADDTHVLCTLDNHGLPCGFLKVSITVELEDTKLSDGTWTVGDKRLVECVDENDKPFHIELTGGASDAYNTSEMTWELLGTVLHGKDGLTTAVKVNGEVHEQVDGVVDLGDIGGGGGTSNYNNLTNKPQIAGIELSGDKSLSELGIQPEIEDIATIRSNAEAGATAVQPAAITDMETKTDAAATYQPKGNYVNDDDSRLSDAREPLAHTHTKSEITDFAHTHTKSEITDFPDSLPASDVSDWAKASTKPTYTANEINTDEGISESKNVQADLTALALDLSGKQDTISDLETIRSGAALGATSVQDISGKQDTLVSGTNIKTVNGNSLLGSGNITISGGGGSSTPSGDPCHYLYVADGAVYNDSGADIAMTAPWGESVTHKAGYWYLNGLGDISNDEMRVIHNNGQLYFSWGQFISRAFGCGCRTTIPVKSQERFFANFQTTMTLPSLGYNSIDVNVLSICNCRFYIANGGLPKIDPVSATSSGGKLVHWLDSIGIGSQTSAITALPSPNTIVTIYLYGLKVNLTAAKSSNLSLASIVYMVRNAGNGTTAITISLHADAYARCEADTTDYTLSGTTYTGIIAFAAAKSISIVSL